MKYLHELFPDAPKDIALSDIKINSKDCKSGDLFVCIRGAHADRHAFAEEAVRNGAAAIIAGKPLPETLPVPVIYVDDPDALLPELSRTFYDHPENDLSLYAVTGTNGKTTTASLIAQLLGEDRCGTIGTNGVSCASFSKSIRNTTPDAPRLCRYLNELREAGCRAASMEATSEALYYGRLSGVLFDVVIFTNITREHLNTHGTFENYKNTKLKLLRHVKPAGTVVLNADDPAYPEERLFAGNRILTYGESEGVTLQICSVEFEKDNAAENIGATQREPGAITVVPSPAKTEKSTGIDHSPLAWMGSDRSAGTFPMTRIDYLYKGQHYLVESPLPGIFNAMNLAAAMLTLIAAGYSMDEIVQRTKYLRSVPGRLEFLRLGQPFSVVLDYAHTPDALEKTLHLLRRVTKGRLITVTGSAGGRDAGKRADMGRIVLGLSDLVIFTMDDPRNEDVDTIIEDLLSGTPKRNCLRIHDRKEAIKEAFAIAKKDDLVYLAGKGRDNYMAIGDLYLPYSDADAAREAARGVLVSEQPA